MTEAKETKAPSESETDFSAGVDLSPDGDGGVIKLVKRPGDASAGRPRDGDHVVVHYVGRLLDGTEFDSSRGRGDPFEFQLGKGVVIKGWDLGVSTMTKGEVALLKCAPSFAYGETGSPPKIPPNSTLVFEVELFSWKGADLSEDKDEGIIKSVVVKGEGYEKPVDGDRVEISLVGRLSADAAPFDDRALVDFVVGEGEDVGVFEGLETLVKDMSLGEKAEAVFKPKYAFGSAGDEKLGVPADAEVRYEVELKKLDKAKEPWEMDHKEKVTASESCKQQGTIYFKAGKLNLAVKQYLRVTDHYLKDAEAEIEEEELLERANQLLLAARLNLSMCYLKLGQSYDCVQAAEAALELEPDNVKGHFRRGEALMLQREWEAAREDFLHVLRTEPENKAAKNKAALCSQKVKEQKNKEKRAYQRIFKTMFEEDAAETPVEAAPPSPKENGVDASKENGAGDADCEEKDDPIGHAEAADIPVLSQS